MIHQPATRRAWLLALALGLWLPAALAVSPGADRVFTVTRERGEFVVEGHLLAAVSPAVAWAVLTDYDHMSEFVIDLVVSRVLERSGERLRVQQRGYSRFGPMRFEYDVEREVLLTAERLIQSRGVRGNLKKFEMETRLEAEAQGVRIHYRAVIVPDFWIPPLLGPALMRRQAEAQFDALLAEMDRRSRQDPGTGTPSP
ncbi:MAG: SRPBCC family protein [Betaproteobacteria bacterium]|jgi:hypothetical protein